MAANPPVVVTGASGLIAKYTIAEFLRRGFAVRGTLRSMEKADEVRRAVAKLGCDPDKVSFIVADLSGDGGWDEAVAGSEIVVHTASPFPIAQPSDPEEVIRPAVDGTLRVLKAATRGAVARVVLPLRRSRSSIRVTFPRATSIRKPTSPMKRAAISRPT